MEPSGEQRFTALTDHKMHGEMCHKLATLVQKIIEVFPALEAVQPQKSGMQALCGLHWALDKAKLLLQQIVHSSKLYLAITSDSVLAKFEKVKQCLDQSLRLLELNVPEGLARQVSLFVVELEGTTFQPDASDREAGNEIVSLLQKEKEVPGFNALIELDVFGQVAVKLGITTGRAVSIEKRALRRLLGKARSEEDKKKELIVMYLLHLLRKYSEVQKYSKVQKFSTTVGGPVPEMISCPSSPSERGSEASTSGRESDLSSELSCFEVYKKRLGNCTKDSLSSLDHVLIPPDEFRCPLSMQLMSDPVIISSGQTYERVCIEKWFEEGHDTCPKTQDKLAHLGVTPNFCVKGLIMSWCERHAIPIPIPPSPPPSPGVNSRWDFSESVSTESADTCLKVGILPEEDTVCMIDAGSVETVGVKEKCHYVQNDERLSSGSHCSTTTETKTIETLVGQLHSSSLDLQCKAAEAIRLLAKDNADARFHLGELGSIPALIGFLSTAVKSGDENAQKTACLALLNVAVNNNRNKAEIVTSGAISLLVNLLGSDSSLATREAAIVVLLTASCLDENKPHIGISGATSFLVDHLDSGSAQGVKDVLTTLFNLSIFSGNHLCIINAGAIPKLIYLLSLGDTELTEKCTAILYNLVSLDDGRSSLAEAERCISAFAEILDNGTQKEKDHVAAILLVLCTNSFQHSQLALQEGIIPSLVMLSVNGSARGKDKAQKLLQHFRDQRQKECVWHSAPQVLEPSNGRAAQGRSGKSAFWRKTRVGSSFGFFRRSKSLSFNRC